jgi:hypothetical protein
LLVAGAAVQLVAFYLPWEHLTEFYSGVPGNHVTVDLPVYTFFSINPGQAYVVLLFVPTLGNGASLAGVVWGALWHATLPLIGALLALMFLTWTRSMIRWPISILYALWLTLTTAQAINFAKIIADVNQGTLRLDPHVILTWWYQLISVSVTISAEPGHPPGLAWGYWVFVLALAVSWLALGMTVFGLLRGTGRRRAAAPEATTIAPRRWPLAAILVTCGVVVWSASLLAVPMVVVDCGSPTVSVTNRVIQQCQNSSALYPLQVIAVRPFVEPPPADSLNPGNQALSMLKYLRDFELLVLALAVTPLALVVAWRARATRGPTLWLTCWAALMLAETALLLWAMAEVLAPDPRAQSHSLFSSSIGPAAVLIPLGVVLVIVGVALYWREALRGRPGAASTV